MQGVHGDVSWARLPVHRVSTAATELSTRVGYQRGRHGPRLRIPPGGASFRRPAPSRAASRPPRACSPASRPGRRMGRTSAGEPATTFHHYRDASLLVEITHLTHSHTSRRAIDNCFTCIHVIIVWESTGRFILATSSAFHRAAGLPCQQEARTPAIGWRAGMADGSVGIMRTWPIVGVFGHHLASLRSVGHSRQSRRSVQGDPQSSSCRLSTRFRGWPGWRLGEFPRFCTGIGYSRIPVGRPRVPDVWLLSVFAHGLGDDGRVEIPGRAHSSRPDLRLNCPAPCAPSFRIPTTISRCFEHSRD